MSTIDNVTLIYTPLSDAAAIGCAIFLFVSGFYAGIVNLVFLLVYIRFFDVLKSPSLIPEIGMVLGDFVIAGLHPFFGAAALHNRWIWGKYGCQLYAFFGFLFGFFLLQCNAFVSFDRYVDVCKPTWYGHRKTRTFVKYFIGLFLHAFFWAVAPMIFWARYSLTPTRNVCTINWQVIDASFVSYILSVMVMVVILSTITNVWFAMKTYCYIKSNNVSVDWAAKHKEGMIILGCAVTTPACYAIFGFIILNALFGNAAALPAWVNALPPIVVKIAGIIHPFFFLFGNPRLMACFRKMMGMSHNTSYLLNTSRIAKAEAPGEGGNEDEGNEMLANLQDRQPETSQPYK